MPLFLSPGPILGRSVWLRPCTTNLMPVPQYSRGDLWRVHSFIKILFKFRMSRRWRRWGEREVKRGCARSFSWPCVSETSSTILISFIDNSRALVSPLAREPAFFISSPGFRIEGAAFAVKEMALVARASLEEDLRSSFGGDRGIIGIKIGR